jgi:F-type H+-transporting ATPase subunit b
MHVQTAFATNSTMHASFVTRRSFCSPSIRRSARLRIVAAAKHEAEVIVREAKERTEEYVERRTVLAEQKIAQAERDAVAEVRTSAVEIAVAAAGKLLADKVDGKADSALFKASISDVKERLN